MVINRVRVFKSRAAHPHPITPPSTPSPLPPSRVGGVGMVIPGPGSVTSGVTCGLSLLLVLVPSPKDFSPVSAVFFPPQKRTLQFQFAPRIWSSHHAKMHVTSIKVLLVSKWLIRPQDYHRLFETGEDELLCEKIVFVVSLRGMNPHFGLT